MHVLLRIASIASVTSLLAAQSATYTLYGTGCNGAAVSYCIAQNDQNPSHFLASLPNEYAYPVTNTSGVPMQIVGFDAYTVTNTGAVQTVNSGIYLDAAGAGAQAHSAPAATAAATGRITVTNVVGWYTTMVSPPLTVAPGECFWIGLDAFSLVAPPQHTNRTPGPIAARWRRPGLAWAATGLVYDPILRVHCGSGAMTVPTLTNTGNPQLGATFQMAISGGLPSLPAFFVWAFQNTTWLSMPIPVDLSMFGAPGCSVWTSTDSANFLLLDGSGNASISSSIPNMPTLTGFTFYNQAAVIDPAANAAGFKVSNAGQGVVGT